MARQLSLLDPATDWRLDEQTREVGRKGVARARAVLAAHDRAGAAGPASGAHAPVQHRPAA